MALPMEEKRNPPLKLGLLRQAVQITDTFRCDCLLEEGRRI